LHYTKRHTHKNSSQTLVRNIALHSSWFPCQASLHAWFHPRRMRFHAKDCTRTAQATERKRKQKKKNDKYLGRNPILAFLFRVCYSSDCIEWFVSNNDWLEMTRNLWWRNLKLISTNAKALALFLLMRYVELY